jgi:uncharacterized protein (TIGR03084 family)
MSSDELETPRSAAVLHETLIADLRDETDSLFSLLEGLMPEDWDKPTPAQAWSIRDQVTHLAYFDDATLLALADPEAFARHRSALQALGDGFPDAVAAVYSGWTGERCRDWLQRSRDSLLTAYQAADRSARAPWYGPDMSIASSITGRLMETWAHGQDIADTLGASRSTNARLRHIADLGVRTFAFTYRLRNRPVPSSGVRVELDGPDGVRWGWGEEGCADAVQGCAFEFCLVVTQRRHVSDTNLRLSGPVAREWMSIAQAFAGAPTERMPAGVRTGATR